MGAERIIQMQILHALVDEGESLPSQQYRPSHTVAFLEPVDEKTSRIVFANFDTWTIRMPLKHLALCLATNSALVPLRIAEFDQILFHDGNF